MSSSASQDATPDFDELPHLTAGQVVEAMAAADRPRLSGLLRVLMQRFEPLLHRIWSRLDGNPSEFDDFRQDVWIKVLEELEALRQPAAFPGFFRQLALNRARDLLTASRRRHAVFVPLNEEDEAHDIPVDQLRAIDQAILVQSYLGILPPGERDVLGQLYVHDRSVREVAQALQISEGAVRTTKSRGIRRLHGLVTADLRRSAKNVGGDDAF